MLETYSNYLTTHKSKVLLRLNACFLFLLLLFVAYAFYKHRYFIVEEDEGIYYNNARLFSETGSVKAFDCIDENVSKVGGTNWYGPMYHILHGGITKIVGVHNYNFLVFNLLCLAGMFLLVYKSGFTYNTKLLLYLSFFAAFPYAYYLFSYYPVTLDLLFGLALALLLKKIHDSKHSGKQVNRTKALFICLILFFSLFRVSTVFWVFGLLPFTKTRKGFALTALLGVACLMSVLIFIRLFNASYHIVLFPLLLSNPFSPSTAMLLFHTALNSMHWYFTQTPIVYAEYLFLLGIAIASLFFIKNKLVQSACLISIIYLLVLIPVYTFQHVFLDKLTAPLYPLLLVAIFYIGSSVTKKAALAILLVLSPIVYAETFDQIQNHRWGYLENVRLAPAIKQFSELKNKIEGNKPVTVECLYKEYEDTIPYFLFMANLPASTNSSYPITYSNHFADTSWARISYSARFKEYGRLHIDYILARRPLSLDSISLIDKTDLLYLYKNTKTTPRL